MIEAAVAVLIAGFSMGIGYLWGARNAREGVLEQVEERL